MTEDSPGYSAKYETYTIKDLEWNKDLDFQLVQVKHSDGFLPKLCKLTIIFLEGNDFLKYALYNIDLYGFFCSVMKSKDHPS